MDVLEVLDVVVVVVLDVVVPTAIVVLDFTAMRYHFQSARLCHCYSPLHSLSPHLPPRR